MPNPSRNDTECQEDSQGNSLAAGVEQVSDDVELAAESFITQYEMPFINKSEATKRSKDRKINGKCTNGTNRRSRVWPIYFIYIIATARWLQVSAVLLAEIALGITLHI